MNGTALRLSSRRGIALLVLLIASLPHCGYALSASAADDAEPPTFTSSNHLLDLLVIARPKTITLGAFEPTAWVFEMCESAVSVGDKCPDDVRTASPYGGIRLQLYPGDHLRMRLINHLPPVAADAQYAHGSDAMMSKMLASNPINIHTHGLIVEPRRADATDHTYGDYTYVLGYPAGQMPSMIPPDETATDKPIQYDIYIPPNHPSGVYWFHPHVHGLNINQLSEGLSGLITVGAVTDYVSPPRGTSAIPTRYFVLKDMQVLAKGNLLDQETARFCSPFAVRGVARNGLCQGWDSLGIPDDRDDRPGNFEGGAWFFTVNGRVDPQIPAPAAPGELWRFLNAGASRAYDLVLQDDKTGNDLPFQIVSLDGVALAAPAGAVSAQSQVGAVGKARLVSCPVTHPTDEDPSAGAPVQSSGSASQAVCATHLVLFPSSRAEIWVFPQAQPASLKTLMVYTGPKGDRWPEATLAHIVVNQDSSAAGAALVSVKPFQQALLSPQGLLGAPVHAGFAGVSPALSLQQAGQLSHGKAGASSLSHLSAHQLATIATRLKEISAPAVSLASPACSALPAGHRRRIFFGVPTANRALFGLGYEEVDENDNPVPGTFRDVAPFDPATINICLPLGPANTPATEEWELVNLSAEAHNFHIHQTEFVVLPLNAPAGNAGALMDNVVLPNGGRTCDGSVAPWRDGKCKVETVTVRIPFAEVGDFVYHCHIGEHQDGGMMAHIRVIASQ